MRNGLASIRDVKDATLLIGKMSDRWVVYWNGKYAGEAIASPRFQYAEDLSNALALIGEKIKWSIK